MAHISGTATLSTGAAAHISGATTLSTGTERHISGAARHFFTEISLLFGGILYITDYLLNI
jgi:hypothetical protein